MDMSKIDLARVQSDALGIGVVKNQFTPGFSDELWYGMLLDRMKVVQESEYPAYVRFDKKSSKFVININMKSIAQLFPEVVDTQFIDSDDRTVYDALVAFTRALIKHELMHVIFKHLISLDQEIDHQLANVCQDSLINLTISEFSKLNASMVTAEEYYSPDLNLPEGRSALIRGSSVLENYTWEELYQKMKDNQDYQNNEQMRQKMNQWIKDKIGQQSEGNDQANEDAGRGNNQDGDKQRGGKSSDLPSRNKGDMMLGDTPVDDGDQLAQDMMNQMLDDILNDKGFQKNVGKVLGSELRKVLSSRQAKVQWKQVLRNVLGRRLTYDFNYTWMKPNRRFDDLEGKRKKFKASVLAMLDVSGSIEAEQLSQFAAELDKISKNSGGNLDIVTYDYEIQEKFTYKEFARVSTIRGGGGTSLNNALNQLGNSLDAYDLIVVMTDGIDDPIQVSRKLGRRLLVVLIDDGSQSFVDSVVSSGGQVIKIKM